MLYRRKVLLTLIGAFGGAIDKLRLQKMLFLLSRQQEKPCYEFVPYRYGGYSFTAQWDINALSERGYLKEDNNTIALLRREQYSNGIKTQDVRYIHELGRRYREKDIEELLKELYEQYPYYAIRSHLVDRVLDDRAKQRVEQEKNKESQAVLFTIGYEGRSLENYLNALIKNGVKMLVDVRNNPVSMKPGFSKYQLEKYCENLEMEYRHYPEVGIASKMRKELRHQADYDRLFAIYREQVLVSTVPIQEELWKLLKDYRRFALTCFENESYKCHRSHLAEAISRLSGFHCEVKHI